MIDPQVESLAAAHVRELASRISGGLHVRLLWCASDGRVVVAVTETKTGEAFSVPVGDRERALDVFHHPYAYAAAHGVDPGATSRPVDSDSALAA